MLISVYELHSLQYDERTVASKFSLASVSSTGSYKDDPKGSPKMVVSSVTRAE